MLWDIDGWVAVERGDIAHATRHYDSYFINTLDQRQSWDDIPEAVIWPQQGKVLWN